MDFTPLLAARFLSAAKTACKIFPLYSSVVLPREKHVLHAGLAQLDIRDPQVGLGGVFEHIYQNQPRLDGYGPWEHGDLRGYFFIH